jgi:small subunit ribosomal protein S8
VSLIPAEAAPARVLHEAASSAASPSRRDGHPVLVLGIRYDDRGRALIDGMGRLAARAACAWTARVPRVRRGLGIAVLSTSKGILSDKDAREQNVGGELLCEVW